MPFPHPKAVSRCWPPQTNPTDRNKEPPAPNAEQAERPSQGAEPATHIPEQAATAPQAMSTC